MESESGETSVCKVCTKLDNLCSTKLGVPICSDCWKDPAPKKSSIFTWNAEIDKITNKVFLGNEPAQKRKNLLKALGITNILVVGSGLDVNYPKDFIYKKIEIDDFYSENIGKYFDDTYKFIDEAIGNVFVHCAAGISRSASVVIAYFMKKEGKTYEQAFDFVKERRNCVNPNEGFVNQLMKYEKKLMGKL